MTIKERPILFSGPMVRAILEGRKSQTRRVVKPQPNEAWARPPVRVVEGRWASGESLSDLRCPYGRVGDRLWVKETWALSLNNTLYAADCPAGEGPQDNTDDWDWDARTMPNRWRPSIHMPRNRCRLTLEVKAVRVERVQAISEADAIAEGIIEWSARPGKKKHYGVTVADVWEGTATEAFARLWGSINGKTHPWASNPWVWVVEFERVNESRRDAGETER